MERITSTNVNYYLTRLNDALRKRNSDLQYKVVGENGTYTIEYYKGDVMVDTLRSGLKVREAYNIIRGMWQVITDGFPVA